MHSLGINIGSTSVKAVMVKGNELLWHRTFPHEGSFQNALIKILQENELPLDLKTIITGTEGRNAFNVNNVIESLCIEEALKLIPEPVQAYISMGGEDLVLYAVDDKKKIINSFSGNKCASGTGEFFTQQLGRMDMTLNDIEAIPEDSRVLKMSTRCSVFMKSDCTHKLNKGEATKAEIAVSLSGVMATKVADFLKRAKIKSGNVILAGGVTRNKFIVRFIRAHFPGINFIVPEQAAYFEAFGAALLAKTNGSILPPLETLVRQNRVEFERFKSLKTALDKVEYFPFTQGKPVSGREYILGVDGGSTTTKACLIDIETNEIAASHYGRTHGDPVEATKKCLIELKKQIADAGVDISTLKITLAATTGSSREILGVFLETGAVYNEIIAHAVGTTFYNPDIDTIFEIGGQDAKYARLMNKVPIDYAMNEACSAGTGSFLEESASGDLNIRDANDIGDIALGAEAPLKFGEHCSAFINSDIRKAVQQGASKEDITAGIVTSIVANYLNRVVGNRTIGSTIVLQGGVAKNKAVPLAFAMLLDKKILVPPAPELMGCFGVGILAKQKAADGLIVKGLFNIDSILKTQIVYEREFKCQACDNLCPIRVLKVNDNKYMFGGRCNKYANTRKHAVIDEKNVLDYVAKRNNLLFSECAAPVSESVTENSTETAKEKENRTPIVGIPRAFSIHTLWPMYSWFFHNLGVRFFLSKNVSSEGTSRIESAYCFPAEIAHGAVQDIIDHGYDYIFLPHFKNLPSYEKEVHANFCPITQSLPYYIQKAFPEIKPERILSPVIDMKINDKKTKEAFILTGAQLGFSERRSEKAFNAALEKQQEYFKKAQALGEEAIIESRKQKMPVIALFGRPYNAFTPEANMGIPKKFTSRGYSIVPFDILPWGGETIFPNMYWYYGQQDMKGAHLIKKEDNIFITWISNFSCAPDSFMLHYLRWIMGTKPYLVLELDSHSADAGVDTRVEAFLDIIEGYRLKLTKKNIPRYDNGLRFINNGKEDIFIHDTKNNKNIAVRGNKKVKMLLSNMGNLSTQLIAAAIQSENINAVPLPVPDVHVLQMARDHASGKECVPSLLVLGNALKYLSSENYRKDEIYLIFVPITTGPCRTGQYFVFYENLFKDMELENVIILILSADNSYGELGKNFTKNVWWSMIIADYMKDIETVLRACAADPVAAIAEYDRVWKTITKAAGGGMKNIVPVIEQAGRALAKIPLKRKVKDCPKVLVVGEIYVRRDDFAVDEVIQLFSAKGIIAKVTGLTEWIYYCDYVREQEIKNMLDHTALLKRYVSSHMKELLIYKLEMAWKHNVDHKIKHALESSGLLVSFPHDMGAIMRTSEKEFVSSALNSEISISSGSAATAMLQDYSGVVNISPFACLIGRVIEGLITPWFRERQYPVMSIEIDGNLLPPNVVNKLEIFMMNVLRFRSERSVGEFISNQETHSINRKKNAIE